MFSNNSFRAISERLNAAVQFLDTLLELGERVGILLATGLVAYAVFQLFFSNDNPAETRSGKVLELIDENWKAVLLVVAPVFYRSLMGILRRIRQITAAGVSATLADTGEEPAREALPERDSRR